jgi:hypothetical protein
MRRWCRALAAFAPAGGSSTFVLARRVLRSRHHLHRVLNIKLVRCAYRSRQIDILRDPSVFGMGGVVVSILLWEGGA